MKSLDFFNAHVQSSSVFIRVFIIIIIIYYYKEFEVVILVKTIHVHFHDHGQKTVQCVFYLNKVTMSCY